MDDQIEFLKEAKKIVNKLAKETALEKDKEAFMRVEEVLSYELEKLKTEWMQVLIMDGF